LVQRQTRRTECRASRPTNSPTHRRRAVRTITRPHGQTKRRSAVQRDDRSGASPHQRHGDRGSDNDVGAARHALPVYVRYSDLRKAGLVGSWTQLLRMIDGHEHFPSGVMLSPNVRAWRVDEIEAWLESRPSARKIMPPGATPPHRRKRVAEEDAANITP
jgi:hypothetical protein